MRLAGSHSGHFLNRANAQALKSDIKQAQLRNTRSFGKQQVRGLDDGPKTSGPKEKITLTRLDDSTTTEPEPAPKPQQSEPDLESLESSFLNSFARNLSSDESSQLAKRAQASQAQIRANGGTGVKAEPVLAALTYNHALSQAKSEYPGMKPAQLRVQAQTDPRAKQLLELLDSSRQYLKETKKQPKAPQEPTFSTLEQANAQAEQMGFLRDFAKTAAQMREDDRKTAAKIHALTHQTNQEILDMMNESFFRQYDSLQKHNQEYVYLLTEVWPDP